jgi:UDP-glucuronate decarboxylase
MYLVEAQKRILVTGGAGFIGSHLCERLLEAGHYVICLDNFFTGDRRNLAAAAAAMRQSGGHPPRRDATVPCRGRQIYNLACPASPLHYQRDPVHTVRTSVLGALNTLELACRLRVPILHTSTSEVYGDPVEHPQEESYWGNVNPIGPRACYDESKRCAETLMFSYRAQHRLATKTVRIFNTYGPRMHPNDGRVVSTFIVQALQNKPITMFGSGKQTRAFCYVDDMVDALTG